MNPEQLLQLVLDYTNTNDYDDSADGWLSTRLEGDVLTVEFMQDSDEGRQTWSASWKMLRAWTPPQPSADAGILVSLREVNVSRAEWDAFVVGVKAGKFDLAVPSPAPERTTPNGDATP